MCGGRPRAPKVIQSGPSQADVNAQIKQQRQAQAAIQSQNEALTVQLQQQAQAIAAETAKQQAELAELAAPPPQSVTITNANPYATSTAAGTAGLAQEQTTAPAKPRKKPKSGLSIGPADISLPGVGINIGMN